MADDHDALMHALEAPDPPAQGRPIRDALAPLAFSPRRVIEALHDAAKTCGALHDARKELRRRLLALLFDGEPLRVRATGADLAWDDEDQSDKVRAAATFDTRGDGVSTFQLSVALDGFFRPKELAASLQSVVEANKEAPIWRPDVATSAPHLESVYKRILKLEECVGETFTIDGGTRHKWHWPIDLKKLQYHYPSIGEVLRHVQFLRVRVFRPGTQDQLWTHGVGYDRFECCFETCNNRVRSSQGFVVPPLTEFGGETSVDITIQVKLRLWLGVISLPELKLRLDHQSDGDDVHWTFVLTSIGEQTWGEYLLSAVLPFPALRRLLLETWCLKMDFVEEGLRERLRMDLPRIGGGLVRLARTFIREKLGSALRLVADVLGALDADLALIRGEALPPPPRR